MKVVFAIKTMVHSVGGAERLVAVLSNALCRDMDVHLLTFDRPEEIPFFDVDGRVAREFVSVNSAARKTGLFELPALLWRLRKKVLEMKPDVVVAFMHSMFVPLQFALLGSGVTVVLSEHTAPPYYRTRKLEFLLLRLFSLFAHSITIVSENIRKLYPLEMRRKMVFLSNPVMSDFRKADISADGQRKTVLSVGRLNADKDHKVLIDAYALLAPDFPEWDMKIVGEGEEHGNLEALIQKHGLKERISLPGILAEMDDVYASAQLFVHPSRYESFGLVTIEAMSHALPVIGFADCPGTNELVVDGQNGVLVKDRSAVALAAAMKELMLSHERRAACGENAWRKAEAFSPASVLQQWKDYIRTQATG